MRKGTKIIISFAVVLIAGLNLLVPAFAQEPFTAIAVGGLTGASGAGLFGSMAGMSGIDIAWSQSGSDPMDAMWNVLNPDHVYFSGEKHEANPQQFPEDIYDYIQIDIGDWLAAQRDFIDEFVSQYSVDDNDTGNTPTVKYFNGIPFVTTLGGALVSDPIATGYVDGTKVGQYFIGSTQCGVLFDVYRKIYSNITYYYNGNIVNVESSIYFPQTGNYEVRYNDVNNNVRIVTDKIGDNYISRNSNNIGTSNQNNGISWSSSTVDTSIFDDWDNARIKIPKSISQLQSGWTLTDFLNELNRIWSGAGEDNIIIEDGGYVPPVPPVPVPSTPLGEVPFDDWVDLWGQGIYQQLENQSDALDFIGSNGTDAIEELESIDENIGTLEAAAESIDTNIGIGNGLLGGIRSLAQSAVNYLEGIAEYVGDLVEEIVAGTETLIAGILNQIPQAFGVIFGPIKQASSIWHYVVEWIQSIGAPFQFIWSMASGTSYYIILPVYASLAAAVVLAFFKRFGR